MIIRDRLPTASALLLLGVPSGAIAQNTLSQPTQENASQPTQLQEVIVTAEKRRESLMEVPVTVTVVTGQQLAKRHEVQLKDYLAQVPGVVVQDGGYGQVNIQIHGLPADSGLAPMVGMEVDGIPIGATFGSDTWLRPDLDPSDMENIQVLYGPQGTLYGDDAMAGLVAYTTVKPQLDKFSGRVEAGVSSVAQGGVGSDERAMLNLPIIDGTLAVRVNAFLRHDPGFIDDIQSGVRNVNDDSVKGGRIDLLWQISDKASLRLNAFTQDINAMGDATELVSDSWKPLDGDLTNLGYPGLNSNSGKYRLYTGTFDLDLGWAHFLSLSGYSTTSYYTNLDITRDLAPDFDSPPTDIFPLLQNDETKKFSQELRLTSPSNQPLEWIAGLYYTREQTAFAQSLIAFDSVTGGVPPDLGTSDLQVPVLTPPTNFREYAGYLTLTYHLSQKFDIGVGGRYTHDDADLPETIYTGLIAGSPSPASSEKDNATTFLATARYHISQNEMAYVRVASGFRPGGSNGVTAGVPPTYAPDKTTDSEVGYKAELLDRRLAIESSLFYIQWTNVQVGVLNDLYEEYIVNGNKAKSQGAQLDSEYLIGGGLSAKLDLAYTEASLVDAGPPGSGTAANAPLPLSPKWDGSFSLEEKFPVTPRWQGSAQLIYSYFGDRLSDFSQVTPGTVSSPRLLIPDYSTVDILGGIDDGRYSLNLFVRNLTNKRAFSNAQSLEPGELEVRVITPRTIGLSVTVNF
jgi:outer membrane receptor protein involved in Fe transport